MIRYAILEDIDRLSSLSKYFHSESPVYRDIEFVEEHNREFLEALISQTNTHCILVYEHNGVIEGMIGCGLEVFMSFNHDELLSMDTGLFVTFEARKSRAAVALIKAYEKWAKGKGVAERNVRLSESAGIKSAETHEFFGKMGYSVCGTSFRRL